MVRTYRIRDTQRFMFLALLFPLMPLMQSIIHPEWTPSLFAAELCFVLFTFWMLYRSRELEIGEQAIRIDRGYLAQRLDHQEIYEIYLLKDRRIQFRLERGTRYIRVAPLDYDGAVRAIRAFTDRNAIPLNDRRRVRATR